MANGRNTTGKGDKGRDGGGFVALPWVVLDCPAYAGLSHPAKGLLIEVARQFVRDNNGRMLLSSAYLKKRGWFSVGVIQRAKQELLRAGFIFQTVMGHRPNKASWYAVTWRALDMQPGYDAGTSQLFKRGAYRISTGKEKRQPLKCKNPKKSERLAPARGTENSLIGPPRGIGRPSVVPSQGAIRTSYDEISIPPYGHHLEMPSAVTQTKHERTTK